MEPLCLEDVLILFTREEWTLLDAAEKKLYMEVMLEMLTILDSVGIRNFSPKAAFSTDYALIEWLQNSGRWPSLLRESTVSRGLQELPRSNRSPWRPPPGADAREQADVAGPAKAFTSQAGLATRQRNPDGKTVAGQRRRRRTGTAERPCPAGARSRLDTAQTAEPRRESGASLSENSSLGHPGGGHAAGDGGASPPAQNTFPRARRGRPRAERLHACEECGKTFRQKGNLTSHRRIHTGERPFPCGECGKAFREVGKLARHARIHAGHRPHACQACGKTFPRPADLTVHTRVHTGDRPYACPDCGKAFRDNSTLTAHRRIHSGDRPHRCQACGKAFLKLGKLARHARTHAPAPPAPGGPHACQQCGKAFRHHSTLVAHGRIHTGERPYRCERCGRTFREPGKLTRHERTHTRDRCHACPQCGKAFLRLAQLTVHARLHTGDRPFACQTCGKAFRDNSTLTAHKRIHTGERPYVCRECGKGFRETGKLLRHARIHARIRTQQGDTR